MTVLCAATAFFVGCDNSQNQADKQIRADLAQARQVALAGGANASDMAIKKLEDAAAASAASPDSLAAAKSALAQANLDASHETMRQINTKEMDLARLDWEITELAQQIWTSNSAIVGYKKYDPQAAHDAIAQRIADAQGGPDKPVWISDDRTNIPTLSAVKQQISDLQGQIAQLQEQVKNVTDERGHIVDQAEQTAEQADKLKGNKAVQVFEQSSNLRRQAGQKSVELDKLQTQIDRLQRSLAIAQGQETTLNEVISQLQDQSAALDAAWKQIDDHVNKQQQLSTQVMGASAAAPASGQSLLGTAGQSLVQKSAELDRLVKEIQQLRGQAQQDASNAAKYFEDAYNAADQFRRQMQTKTSDPKNVGRPEVPVWKSMVASLDPMHFRLQQAAAQRTLGDLYSSNADSLSRRISLRESLKSAVEGTSLTVPAEINDSELDKSLQTAITSANDAYGESDKVLSDVAEGQSADQANAAKLQANAHLGRALTLYGWSQIAKLSGDQQNAGDRLKLAIQERNTAADGNTIPIPAMPSEMGDVPAPATQPTS
jgi:predicted nuclease with TOPRIM domain